jgi:Fe-S oxidoreductase
LAGIDSRRPLPRFAARTLTASWGRRNRSLHAREGAANAAGARPLIFTDTFTNYFHPEIGLAAGEVLDAASLAPELADNVCCGRPLISQGLLARARRLAAENTRRLHAHAAAGRPLVFLEPSCLSAVREDVPALLRGDDQRRAQEVAGVALLFEEFVEREHAAGRMHLPLRAAAARILLHGHCHQKSMGALLPARALLERVPDAQVVDLDAGCCGMAGSFGYAREHFDVSSLIGERKLLPAVRAMKDGDLLVAAGTSCRQQVKDFTGVRALHPAELLRALL